jgi:hypothetical protein
MADDKAERMASRRHLVGPLLLLVGAAVLLLSLIWPQDAKKGAGWDDQKAAEYRAASLKLTGLAHQAIQNSGPKDDAAMHKKLDEAKAEYEVLRSELDAAIARPKNTRLAMRIVGALCVIAGAAVVMNKQQGA